MGTLSLVAPLVLFEKSRLWAGTGFHLLPSFIIIIIIIIPHSRTQLLYTNSYTYSHPNFNFLQYTIQILVPHIMWSAQAVHIIVQWVGISKNKKHYFNIGIIGLSRVPY